MENKARTSESLVLGKVKTSYLERKKVRIRNNFGHLSEWKRWSRIELNGKP